MIASGWAEIRRAFAGTLLLARGDRRGLAYFDTSLDGFWRSFRAALLCYPLFLLLLAFRVSGGQWQRSGPFRILAAETIAYVISWAAFALIMLRLTRLLGCDHRFLGFMVAYNWSQLPQSLLFVALALLGVALPGRVIEPLSLAAAVAVIAYEWFIARAALDIPGSRAALVVVADLLLATIISRVTDALY
jgi:hypothetical protein